MEAKAIAEALPDMDEAMKRYWIYCRENADSEYREFNSKIVPRKEKMVGVRIPKIREVSRPIKKQDKKIIKEFISHLWDSKIFEDRLLAAQLAAFIPEWTFLAKMAKNADNWVLTDELCCQSIGPLLLKEPQHFFQLEKWAKSKNKWVRRIATVSLIQWMRSSKPKKKALLF